MGFSKALELKQISTPANPPSGAMLLYFKGDGLLYRKDSSGVESAVDTTGSGGSGTQTSPAPVRLVAVGNFNNVSQTTIDGVTWAAGDRILLTGQATPSSNGIFIAQPTGTLVRASDADTAAKIAGQVVVVQQGGTYGGTQWVTSFKSSDTLDTTAMNWSQVDALTDSVRVVSVSNITSLSGLPTIDGVALNDGDRALLTGQSTASQNGIWSVLAGTWVRAADANTSAEVAGRTVSVQAGTSYGGTQWVTTFKGTDTLGTTAMSWYQVIKSNDSRLSDARTPLAHSHPYIPTSQVTAPGDLIGATGSGSPINVPVGSDGTFLKADSTMSSGLSYGYARLSARRTTSLGVSGSGVWSTAVGPINLQSNCVYLFKAFGQYSSGATTTGLGLRCNGTMGVTAIRHTVQIWTSSTGSSTGAYSALTTSNVQTAVGTAGTNYIWNVEGLIRVSTGGTFQIECSSSSATTVTLQPDAYLTCELIA